MSKDFPDFTLAASPNLAQFVVGYNTDALGGERRYTLQGIKDLFQVSYDARYALATASITIGSTNIALGGSTASLAGLTSVTSTGFTGALTGNASTATALATARTINGVSFNGTADIVITATPTSAINLAASGAGGVTGILPAANGGTSFSTYSTGDFIYASAANTLSKMALGTNGQFLGVSGGVLGYFTPAGTGNVTAGGTLTSNQIVLGAGTTAVATLGSLGTTTTVLHGNAAGAPTFAAVSLTADISGTLGQGNGGTGFSTYTTGDLLYASATNTLSKLALGTNGQFLGVSGGVLGYFTPSGTGNVTAAGTLTANQIVLGAGTTAVATLGSLGTTTTVLHGNAAGAPTFGAVSLTADVSGRLPFANLTQGSALSVLGVTGNATADFASIAAGTDNQVLRRSGTALAFGAVNLASSDAVTGALTVANGGTGVSTTTAYSVVLTGTTATGAWKVDLGPGTATQVLTSNGAGAYPSWQAAGSGSGTKTIATFIPQVNEPPTSNYATFLTRNSHPVYAFDDTTQETVICSYRVPQGSTLTSGLSVFVQWCAAVATTGTIGWDVAFERIVAGGIDIDSDSFGTAQTITAATVSATSGITSTTNVSFSQAQLPSSFAAGDMYRIRIRRDVALDTAAGDAQLLQVECQLN